ncbi:MerR family transcriptional regulator [Kribbella sp. NPDC056345]|uniref:MerR family transcriptional regulator n=1 Tax=Kribbella sp. NPDC056345 TaxID=3345789 RepID=UPI0035DA762E
MRNDELVPIGHFARLSGLSIHALRHYDDVGLLTPADVDPVSGYRRYRRDQVRLARLIRALRWVDLPVEELRSVLATTDEDGVRDVLEQHRSRLERRRDLLTNQLGDLDRFTTKGLSMPTTRTGARPVQLKIAVHDLTTAIAFYEKAFGFQYDVTRRTQDGDYSSFMFGTYGDDGFFMLHLLDDPDDTDRPGPTTFGLLMDDLDADHARVLTAGATEVVAPRDAEGMPRCSAVKDPSNNWIWLYQA